MAQAGIVGSLQIEGFQPSKEDVENIHNILAGYVDPEEVLDKILKDYD